MQVTSKKAEVKSFTKPDEVRTFPKGRLELVNIGGDVFGRATFKSLRILKARGHGP
ncbi:MAG: hypothetical protein ABSB79_09935 [Syntrophales bacterium]|jgi:hypothetical protein